MSGTLTCFFCGEERLEGKGIWHGKSTDGRDVSIAVCVECVPLLGALLADAAEELPASAVKSRWLSQALEKVKTTAWATLAMTVEGTRQQLQLRRFVSGSALEGGEGEEVRG